MIFQPTLPMRGATDIGRGRSLGEQISTHAPHAGSDARMPFDRVSTFRISTHAPHAGSDAPYVAKDLQDTNFNPRSPCGERHERAAYVSA